MKADLNQLTNESLLRILELTKKLAVPFDLTQMLDEVLQAGMDVLQADSGSLWLYHEEDQTLKMYLPEVVPQIVVNAGEGIVGEALATNKVINVRDCYADARFNRAVDKSTGYKTESLLSIPLVGFNEKMVGVLQLLNKKTGPFDDQDELLAVALAAQSAVALQRTQMTKSLIAKERLDEEIAIARDVQLSTLPQEMPVVPGYQFDAGFIPAEHTGGDLFDLVDLGSEIFMLMGDATGHGIGAALSAVQLQSMLRVAFRTDTSLNDAYRAVNNQLVEDLPDNKFLTAFIGFLDPEAHKITYHAPGQGPLLHYHANSGECSWYSPTNFPVGVMDLTDIDAPQELQLEPGDIFAVISDGVYEYHNSQDDQFGESGVKEILLAHHQLPMSELKDKLLEGVFAFGGGAEQLDDITIVLVKRDK